MESSTARKYLSGSQKRKRARDQVEKEKQILAKVPKLTDFFLASGSSARDKEVVGQHCQGSSEEGCRNVDTNVSNIAMEMMDAGPSEEKTSNVVSTCQVQHITDEEVETNIYHESPLESSPAVTTCHGVTKGHVVSTMCNLTSFDSNPVVPTNTEVTEKQVTDTCHQIQVESSQKTQLYSNDPAQWTSVCEELRNYFIDRDVDQNICDFSKSMRLYPDKKRYLSKDLFSRIMLNGECRTRDWLIYSPSTGNVFCYVCKLFSVRNTAFSQSGFSDWKNANCRVNEHEHSHDHRMALITLHKRKRTAGRIDAEIVKQYQNEYQYWKNVLKRVVAVVRFLSERGLAFRGDNELLGSPGNGNYLGNLELISQFDPFLADHIAKFGNAGRGRPSYLSSTICNEFIDLMGKNVMHTIVEELKMAKYYSISVDSTPDISHVDQLTFIVRYVKADGNPVERFLKFIPIHSHTSENLANTVMSVVQELGIEIKDCRGQTYDNASNMAGKYSGLQARIKEHNPLADFIPCSAHSLNLVGSCAAECCLEAVSFFGFLQALYTFFSASTHRWHIMRQQLPSEVKVPKSLSVTRWSARADACSALFGGYQHMKTALQNMADDPSEGPSTRMEAESLAEKMELLETALMTAIWNSVLQRLHATSKSLQKVGISLKMVVDLYSSLTGFLQEIRNNFDEYERKAKTLVDPETSYQADISRQRRRKYMFDEPRNETTLTGREKFRAETFLVIIDTLSAALQKRKDAYDILQKKFGVLTDFPHLNVNEIRKRAESLVAAYPQDLEESFTDEFIQFTSFVSCEEDKDVLNLCKLLKARGLESTFPNVEAAFHIYLCTPAANCSGERSFSTLSRVKNKLRSTMDQERLNALTILSIESELVKTMDFDDLISDFAQLKSRKKQM